MHVGALGWVGFMVFGMAYYLVPKLWNTQLYSKKLANAHFWIGLIGIVLYALSMWTSGVSQALMWLATKADGTLAYPDFMEIVIANMPMYWIRALGGLLYVVSVVIMFYNLFKSLAGKSVAEEKVVEAPRLTPQCPGDMARAELFGSGGDRKSVV